MSQPIRATTPALRLAMAWRALAARPRRALAALVTASLTLAGAAELAPPLAGVSATVAGIVGYTRWPAEGGAIRLCTLGGGSAVDTLQATGVLGPAQGPLTARAVSQHEATGGECDVLYIGQLGPGASRDVLKALAGRPVLLLGEGADFCSDGGMFCLLPGAAAARFNVNLDAVARSGLRVNPMVLRLGRGASSAGAGS